MIRTLAAALLLFGSAAFAADEKPAPKEAAKPNTLTEKEIAEGWILLFDGETTYGWKVEGDVKVEGGWLVIGGEKAGSVELNSTFQHWRLSFDFESLDEKPWQYTLLGRANEIAEKAGRLEFECRSDGGSTVATDRSGHTLAGVWGSPKGAYPPLQLRFAAPAGGKVRINSVRLKPLYLKPLFNGKDLTGWKEFPGKKSKWAVDDKGELTVKDGPGDLQTEGQWADFILQIEAFSHGKALNSGVFFRCIAGEYQNGYEAQIQNGYKDNDRTKPADFGTGAIYRRIAARKVVSNDNEWFTMTVLARGNHIATWVNGYQTVDWTDERAPDNNPRKGCKTGKGHISLQGHDPTTNLSFRNIRLAELPPPEAK